MYYYVISLYHTQKREKYLTLWQPDNKSYCYSKEMGGLYESPIEGYHNSDSNIAIPEQDCDALFEKCTIDSNECHAIPNTKKTWEKLGITFKKGMLVRLSPYVPKIQ